MRLDHLGVAAGVGALDLPATAVQVADDVAQMNSSGVTTSTFMIGSSSLMPDFCAASRIAPRPAISNASADESTSW